MNKKNQSKFPEFTYHNWLYSGATYDYDDYYCNGCYGCETGDDYCRGGQYYGLHVTDIDMDAIFNEIATIISQYLGGSLSELSLYALERILTGLKMWDTEDWEILTGGGYYGDEIDEIRYNRTAELNDAIRKFILCATEHDRIRLALIYEYGLVLDWLKKATFSIENINISELKFPQTLYAHKVSTSNCFPRKHNIFGIVKVSAGKPEIVDGYHRLSCARRLNYSTVKVVVARAVS